MRMRIAGPVLAACALPLALALSGCGGGTNSVNDHQPSATSTGLTPVKVIFVDKTPTQILHQYKNGRCTFDSKHRVTLTVEDEDGRTMTTERLKGVAGRYNNVGDCALVLDVGAFATPAGTATITDGQVTATGSRGADSNNILVEFNS
jgi:hypothetical protein